MMPKNTEAIRGEQSKPRAVGDMKHGLGGARPQMSILPRIGLVYGGRALEYGADKYARGNYHGPPPAKLGENAEAKRLLGYVDAAMRHLTHVSDQINRALGTGGDVAAACAALDDEASGGFPASNLPHLAHALASLLIGVSCAADGKLIPEDPGQPWQSDLAKLRALAGDGDGDGDGGLEGGLPQKDNPAAERARVQRLTELAAGKLPERHCIPAPQRADHGGGMGGHDEDRDEVAELDKDIRDGFQAGRSRHEGTKW